MNDKGDVEPQVLHDVLLEAATGLAARFGERAPTEKEVKAYLLEKLLADGCSEKAAKKIVEELE